MTRMSMHTRRLGIVIAAIMLSAIPGLAGLEMEDHTVPPEMEAGAERVVELTIRNRGDEPWDRDSGFKLSYHWLDEAGNVVVWDGLRSELGLIVLPGETVRVHARVMAPTVPGPYRLQWDVVQEGIRWLSELDHPTPPSVPVRVRAAYAFAVVRGNLPRWLGPGERSVCRLLLRNDGSKLWSPDSGFALSYHWLGPQGETLVWDGLRTPLPSTVPPGGFVWVEAKVHAPDRSGRFWMQWDMVHEGVVWFSQRDPSPERARTVVVAADPLTSPVGWAMLSLAAALVAVHVVGGGGLRALAGFVAVADILWCGAAVVVKQAAVLGQLGQRPEGRGVLLTLAGLAVILVPSLLLPRRIRVWCCWSVAALATTVMFADLVYGRFFGDILSASVLGAAGQTGEVGASIASLLAPGDLWFWIDLVAGAVLMAAVARLPAEVGRRATMVVAASMALLLVAGSMTAAAMVRSRPEIFSQVFRSVLVAREVGVVNFHVMDGGRALLGSLWRRPPTEDEIARLTDWFRARAPLRGGTPPWFGADLVMVQAESLQGFVLDLEIGGREVTPFLNRWVRDSMLFTDVTDQTAQGRSSDSELATQVSLLPPPVGAAAFLFAGNRFTGMAEALGTHGYHTLSAVAFEGSFWNRRLTHPGYGYSESLFDTDFEHGEFIGWGLNDRDFFVQVVGRLARRPGPFSAYLLTLSLHHPFEGFPDRYKELDLGDLEGSPLGNYVHTMRFFDRAFSALMTRLEEVGLAARTVVALWGDHDAGLDWSPELAELTGFRHDPAGWYLSQRVPFAIRVPGVEGLRGTSSVPAGHQDVAPTLLALLGVDPSPYAFVGRNLLGEPGAGPVVGEYQCWRDARHLFLQGGGSLEDGECYQLPDLTVIDVQACGAGFADAMAQVEASQMVLEHDLQQEIHHRLAEHAISPDD